MKADFLEETKEMREDEQRTMVDSSKQGNCSR